MNDDALLKECHAIGLDPNVARRIQRSFQADCDAQLGMFEFSLLLIKYQCLDRRDELLDAITHSGLQVVASKDTVLAHMDAVRFAIIRAHGKGTALNVNEHAAVLESLAAGPLEALIVAGADVVQRLNVLFGRENSIGDRRSKQKLAPIRTGGFAYTNGLHCSANRNEAHEELSLIFPNYVTLLKTKGYGSQVDQWLFSLWRSEPHSTLLKNRFLEVLRYSANGEPNRNPEFLGRLRNAKSSIQSKISTCLSTIGSFLSSSSKSTHPSKTSVSSAVTPLTEEEEDEIAYSALMDELGVTDLSPYLPTGSRFSFLQANQRIPPLYESSTPVAAPAPSSDEDEFVDAPDLDVMRPCDFSHVTSQIQVPKLDRSYSESPTDNKALSDTFLTRRSNHGLVNQVTSALEMYRPAVGKNARTRPSVSRESLQANDADVDVGGAIAVTLKGDADFVSSSALHWLENSD